MAALKGTTAARLAFRLAALHSVAERVNPRKARPPTPFCPHVPASAGCPHLPLAGRRVHGSRPQLEPGHRGLRSFPPSGTNRDGSTTESGAADRGGGGVRYGLRANGDGPRVGWYACPWRTLFATEWSAARRKRPTAAVLHLSATISADLKAVRFRRAAAENFRPEIFDARAEPLRSQRESAVGRRSAATPMPVPVCPETVPHASATPTPQVRPRLLQRNEECPH